MKKKFDAVNDIREIRDKLYEQTKDKSDEDLISYYQKKAEKARSMKTKVQRLKGEEGK